LYDIENKPEKMLILMQKDVGDRITQTPSNSPLSRGRTKTFSLLDEGKLRDGDWFISPLDKGGLRGV
jgi:hypothetical protein